MSDVSHYHKELASGRWFTLSLAEQLGNTGSEVNRAILHFEKNRKESGLLAFYRALELIDLTISDKRWNKRLKEICRLRELLCDVFVGENTYNTTYEFLKKYFYYFGYAARNKSF